MLDPFKSLGSVDPLGVVQDLDPLLASRSACYTTEEIFYAATLPGFDSLPRQLIPDGQCAMQPPVYLYGWEIDRNKLLRYTKRNNLREYVEELRWSEDEENEDEDIEPEIVIVHDRPLTILNVLFTLAKEAGVQPRYKCALGSVFAHGTMVPFFALYSNYQLADAPPKAEIIALQNHLRARIGETEPPKWLPDDDEF